MKDTHEWWINLTLKEQADYVMKQMRKKGKIPDRDLVIENLVKQGQYREEEEKTYELELALTDKELDIITSLLNLCARSIQIFADDPDDFDSGLHEFVRTKEEKELAKEIIQKIGRECL